MMDLLFIRHGEAGKATRENEDPSLTEKGIQQAHRIGHRLRAEVTTGLRQIERIYTSDLARASQTAQIVQSYLATPLETLPGLHEIDMGRLRVETWAEVEADFPGYYAEWSRHTADLPYPKGERGEDVKRRALPAIEAILEKGVSPEMAVSNKTGVSSVAIFTHGGVIRSLLCAFLGLGQEKRFLFGKPLENCSLTVVRCSRPGQYFIHTLNDASHLIGPPRLID